MTDTPDPAAEPANTPAALSADTQTAPKKKKKDEESFFAFLLKLAIIVFVFRSFIFSPFNIPSESMLPKLVDGDYLLAAKWPYGYSKYSLPFSMPLIPGRVLAGEPKRGDVVIFKAPPGDTVDYIKRVIGLPGDTVQMIGGQLYLNGKAIPKVKVADFVVPVSVNTHCYDSQFQKAAPDGSQECSYPRYRETLPNGKSYDVLDLGPRPQDDTPPVVVPEGHLFMMGDNRDNSLDSRFPAVEGAGIGLVPEKNLIGRAEIIMWSTDGSARWYNPISWFTAARWNRIGNTF